MSEWKAAFADEEQHREAVFSFLREYSEEYNKKSGDLLKVAQSHNGGFLSHIGKDDRILRDEIELKEREIKELREKVGAMEEEKKQCGFISQKGVM